MSTVTFTNVTRIGGDELAVILPLSTGSQLNIEAVVKNAPAADTLKTFRLVADADAAIMVKA